MAYTVEEAAEAIGVSEYFFYELIKQNEISPIVRLGKRGIRVPVKTLENFIEQGGVKI
jgi:excisionase family DNA binding protein